MVDCERFLDRYSDFRDGLLPERERMGLEAHLAECPECARYDEVVGEGIRVLLGLPEIDPSPDFAARLQHRLFHLEEEMAVRRRSSGASVALTLGIAAAIGAAAWLPVITESRLPLLPPAVAHAPYHPDQLPIVFHAALLPQTGATVPVRASYHPRAALPHTPLLGSPVTYTLLQAPRR
jgi:hypothetical protein